MKRFLAGVLLVLSVFTASAQDSDDWNGYAAPSVHLSYPVSGQQKVFENTVKPTISAPGTYYMVGGWNHGYFGLQEQADGRKLVIFSVWDNALGRAKVTYKASGVTAGRFGGEGTGAQSFYNYNWALNRSYAFRVTAALSGARTVYTGWFNPGTGWVKLVAMSTPTNGEYLDGLYSFVEDFLRDGIGPEYTHRAVFGQPSVTSLSGVASRLRCARFTTDGNSDPRVDAGPTADNRWFLATGGSTQNVTTAIDDSMCVQ